MTTRRGAVMAAILGTGHGWCQVDGEVVHIDIAVVVEILCQTAWLRIDRWIAWRVWTRAAEAIQKLAHVPEVCLNRRKRRQVQSKNARTGVTDAFLIRKRIAGKIPRIAATGRIPSAHAAYAPGVFRKVSTIVASISTDSDGIGRTHFYKGHKL